MHIPDYLVVDTETSGATNNTYGNPFTSSNRLCVVGYGNSSGAKSLVSTSKPLPPFMGDSVPLFVAFNAKFDLHWLRRSGVNLSCIKAVWDCQLAEFIISRQSEKYPALELVTQAWGIPGKFTDIETEYWDKGIDTPDIPIDIVTKRVESDVIITSQLFEKQWAYLEDKPKLKRLIWIACQDQLVLEEMEWNGLAYDMQLSLTEGHKLETRISEIERELTAVLGIDGVNWSSGQQLSVILFGGTLKLSHQEEFVYTYKSGKRKGQTILKTRWVDVEKQLPQRAEPAQGTELKKEGLFSTDEDSLLKLKPFDDNTRKIVKGIQELRTLSKQLGTYYYGIPKLYEEMEWENNILHGNLNSCVTVTGRLSSTRPNQQNLDHGIRKCLITRF